MRFHVFSKIAVFALAFALAGCATTSKNRVAEASLLIEQADYQSAATLFLDKDGQPDYDADKLETLLLVGKIFHDAGLWAHSYTAFELAAEKLAWKADRVDTGEELVRLVGTTITSDTLGRYTGKIYEGVLIDYYQTINQLMLGDESKVRVHLNRTDLRQENAELQFDAFAREVTKSKLDDSGKLDTNQYTMVRENLDADTNFGLAQVPTASKIELRNSMADVLGAFLRLNGTSDVDRQSSKVAFSINSAATVVSNRQGSEEAFTSFLQVFDTPQKPQILVIYEDGVGPSVDEFRIDLPLFLITDEVLYSGIALPKFAPGRAAHQGLALRHGQANTSLTVLTDINRTAALEFEATYQQKVAKQIVSAVIKTGLQAVANKEIEDRSNAYFALLGKVVTASLQAASTQADTRHWSNLPNTIQGALLINDGSGAVEFHQNGITIERVEVPAGQDVVIYARSSASSGRLATYVRPLPLGNDPVLARATN